MWEPCRSIYSISLIVKIRVWKLNWKFSNFELMICPINYFVLNFCGFSIACLVKFLFIFSKNIGRKFLDVQSIYCRRILLQLKKLLLTTASNQNNIINRNSPQKNRNKTIFFFIFNSIIIFYFNIYYNE